VHVCFCCVCFSFSVLSQEIGCEERLRNGLFLCRVGRKTLTQPINYDVLQWVVGFQQRHRLFMLNAEAAASYCGQSSSAGLQVVCLNTKLLSGGRKVERVSALSCAKPNENEGRNDSPLRIQAKLQVRSVIAKSLLVPQCQNR